METRLPTLSAILAIAALLGWLAYRVPDGTPSHVAPGGSQPESPTAVVLQERSAGSAVPCAVPLAWRVARVDPEFGVDLDEATAVVAEAAALWEEGTGRDLFEHAPDDGFPIRLVYDERQERAAERARRARELDALGAEIEARRTSLAQRDARHRAAMADHLARMEALDRRIEAHNAAVREWNAGDDQSEDRSRELNAAGEALRREREALLAERPALDDEQAALRAAQERLNDMIREHERRVETLDVSLPPEEVEAGVYREAVSRQGAEVVEVSREIRLYRFTSAPELRVLAAHEMGHALGLGHMDGPGAVMSARARDDAPVSRLSGADVALFERTCPAGAEDPSR